MIRAYDQSYVETARRTLASMFDFAVNDLMFDIDEFYGMFLCSGIAGAFGCGDCRVVAGRSGVELTYEILEACGVPMPEIEMDYSIPRSPEYWLGWALAYYQWYSALSFSEIAKTISASGILAMYEPYHEMDIRQFCDKMDELYTAAHPESCLKARRLEAGLSQSELAKLSGIPVRTIQQYEQRQKNINKAQAEYLVALAQVLCCAVTDIMEKAGAERAAGTAV